MLEAPLSAGDNQLLPLWGWTTCASLEVAVAASGSSPPGWRARQRGRPSEPGCSGYECGLLAKGQMSERVAALNQVRNRPAALATDAETFSRVRTA